MTNLFPKFPKNGKGFRISAKRVFLTYSQVPETLTVDQVEFQLYAKPSVHKYLIAEERHQDGGKHFHVLLESKTKFNVRDPAFFDLQFEGISYHGNYQAARNYKSVAKYVGKDSKVRTNYKSFVEGEFLSLAEDLLKKTPEMGVIKTCKYYLNNYTSHALKGLSVTNVNKSLQAVTEILARSEDREKTKVPFSIDNFMLTPKIQQWTDQNYQPTLLLVGDGGTGKTAFAKTLAQANNWNMLICNHLEGLKALSPEHDIILFDDLSFRDIDDQQLLAIFANDETRQVRVLNGAIDKPQSTKQIITLNTNVLKKLKKRIMHKQFLRRMIYVQLDQSLIVNLNSNIEVSNHTKIYNNEETIKENERMLNDF